MSALRYLLIAAAAGMVAGAPHGAKPRSLDLHAIINNTVCAIDVTYDDNPDRIPQRIKMLECAARPDRWCAENNIRKHDCCHHRHMTECVQMTDVVVVFNKVRNATETLDVAVGCACMIRRTTLAPGVPPPDP